MIAPCSVEDCGVRVYARGFCQHHYLKWWRYGDPHRVRTIAPLPDRIFARVTPTGFCWEWTGYRAAAGYGMFVPARGQTPILVHRFVYEHLIGPIPDGLQLDHLCRNRACVNPDHLEPVTQRENLLRGFGFAGTNSRKSACVNGHPFDADNTYHHATPTGRGRSCRACHAENERKRRARIASVLEVPADALLSPERRAS